MTQTIAVAFTPVALDDIADVTGRIAVILGADGKIGAQARRVGSKTRGALARFAESEAFGKMATGDVTALSFPTGLAAEALLVVKLDRNASQEDVRKAGAALAKLRGDGDLTVVAAGLRRSAGLAFGIVMRTYGFDVRKSEPKPVTGKINMMVNKPEEIEAEAKPMLAVAEGVFFTRDLTNEPANHLTTTEFGDRLAAMRDIGLEVEVLEEDQLEALGMGSLLCVGQGSASPSKVVVMQWNGGGDEAPFAFVGKGVVFDTGGISLKPAGGMEDMTMDMGGAGVVSGVMRALALRGAKANVVGLVGIVENMPSDRAVRPGDVVTSMKGDTIEVINTDAEGRLVLADVLWYAQERFKPTGMIDLATLTGAIIIGLGHENAGVFSNDNALCRAFLNAAEAEGEGAWRMPLGDAYDKMLKSNVADMQNIGGRPAGSITAAQFLQRFVKEDCPWIHLDIAGVASVKSETALAPKGATGWGVMALDRLIRDKFEG